MRFLVLLLIAVAAIIYFVHQKDRKTLREHHRSGANASQVSDQGQNGSNNDKGKLDPGAKNVY